MGENLEDLGSRQMLFMWLAVHNKCWTADRLANRDLPHPDHCPMCDQEPEQLIISL
jgi:hypothetical protein